MNNKYHIGATVTVKLPRGNYKGIIKEISCKWSFSGEVKYRIQGEEFDTITSARCILDKEGANKSCK